MTVLWMDGFDHYGTGDTPGGQNMLLGQWTALNNGLDALSHPVSTVSRTGIGCLQLYSGSGIAFVSRAIGSSQSNVGIGLALLVPTTIPTLSDWFQMQFKNYNGWTVAGCEALASGGFRVFTEFNYGIPYQPARTIVGTFPANVLVAGAWNYIEFFADITNHSYSIRVNNVTIGSGTGVTWTSYDSILSFDILGLQSSAGTVCYLDDMVCWNTAGTVNNTFLGDRKVATLMPNADTATANWHLNGAGTGYGCISEIPQDGDTTYISALGTDTLPEASIFDFVDLTTDASSVNAVQTTTLIKKSNSGACTVATDLTSGGTSTASAVVSPASTYRYYDVVSEYDPNTAAPWTPAGVRSAKVKFTRVT